MRNRVREQRTQRGLSQALFGTVVIAIAAYVRGGRDSDDADDGHQARFPVTH
jgi:hypothetical protein